MKEIDKGKEGIIPEFSATAQIYDKIMDCNYRGDISLPVDSLLRDFTIDSIDDETKLSIKVRIDPSGKNGSPQVIIKNYDEIDVLYMLKERFDKEGEKYFSLGAPPLDISNKHRAVKADFRIFFQSPSIN